MDIISKLRDEFNNKYTNSSKIKNLVEKLENGDVEYGQAHEFAIELGEMLANVFKENLSVDMFPDGKISYGIADKILNETLGKNYDLISDYSRDIQTIINKKAGFNIKCVRAEKNQSRIDNMVKKVSDDNFENVQWMFDEPVKNFSQSIVDDTVKANADFQYKLGMQPKIIRKSTGHCCDWCEALVGEYDYPYEVPPDVYRRHRFCRCTVEHRPGGKKVGTNIHTKKIMNSQEDIDERIRRYEKEIKENEITREKRKSERIKKSEEFENNKKATHLASKRIQELNEVEPSITSNLKEISKKTNGKMVGLEYRLKSKESLTRKILSDAKEADISLESASKNIKDILRYTIVYDEKDFVKSYFDVIDDFNKKGYNTIRIKNTFKDGQVYKGVNTIVDDGNGNLFELQYHTPKSIEVKEGGLHTLYEQQRILDKIKDIDEYNKLKNDMIELSNTIPIPDGIERIK